MATAKKTKKAAAPAPREETRPMTTETAEIAAAGAAAHQAPPQSAPRKSSRRKQFIAMAGNIGVGKTTAAKMISQKFGFELFDEPVIDNRFLKDYYRDMKRWSFTLQLEFLIRRVEHHELIHKVSKSCIQDRTLYEDPEIFAKYLHGLGFMTDTELDLYFEYFQRLTRDVAHPTRSSASTCPTSTCCWSASRSAAAKRRRASRPSSCAGCRATTRPSRWCCRGSTASTC